MLKNEIANHDASIPGEKAGVVLANVASGIKKLVSKIEKNGCGPSMANEILRSSTRMKASIDALGLNKKVMAYIPDIHLSRSEADTKASLLKYANGCLTAGMTIKSIQRAAGRKLSALADAVENSYNPSESKINAHYSRIMNSLKASLFNAAYNQQEVKNELRNEAQEASMANLQQKTISSALDWDLVQSRFDEEGIPVSAEQIRGLIGKYKYPILRILLTSKKDGIEDKKLDKEEQETIKETVYEDPFGGDDE